MGDVAGESSAEKQDNDSIDGPQLHGNLDDIFDDDDAEESFDGPDNLLDHGEGSGDFENAFDESPPVAKKMKSAAPSRDKNASGPESEEGGWQDDVADIPHRRELIRQIAQLLRDRKQNPTPKWLKELPYKARKLEEQLYKTAPSLQAYLDKATVKHRLKKVAHAITSQFRIAKGKSPSSGKRTSKKSSDISLGSILSAMSPRNSNTSASGDMSDLERQQQVNQKLQDQILENIRQQQQIMRNLMGSNSNSNNNNNQQGGNQQHSASDQMMAATMASQANQMTEQMGAAQMASQMSSQMGGMSNAMGMSAASLNTSGYNATAGMNSGGYNSLGLSAASLANMNAAGLNPLLVQQLMQQRMAATQSPAAVQMAMMNLRNSLSGQTNPAAMNPAAHMGESMSSVIPAPPLTSTSSAGINPTMPPPNMNAAMRSSFTSGSGYEDGGGGTGHTDLSLSPNSFKW